MSIKEANRRVRESERIVAGWREFIARLQADGRDVTVARDLLRNFEDELGARRSRRDLIHEQRG
jgi:hypothetical protein